LLKKPAWTRHIVIPADAGIHKLKRFREVRKVRSIWIPAYAGDDEEFFNSLLKARWSGWSLVQS